MREGVNIQNIVREIKNRNEHEDKKIKDSIKLALEELEKIKIDFLRIDKNMEKMILFGSLAENNIDSTEFDIDIAVKSEKYYQLIGRALQSQFKVDVIDLESIHSLIKKNILKTGKVIYEKKQG